MRFKLRCRVSPGARDSEFAVVVRSGGDKEFVLHADLNTLTFERTPSKGEPVDAWIDVELVKEDTPYLLVKLPGPLLDRMGGPYLWVHPEQTDLPPISL